MISTHSLSLQVHDGAGAVVDMHNLSIAYAGMGQLDQALEWQNAKKAKKATLTPGPRSRPGLPPDIVHGAAPDPELAEEERNMTAVESSLNRCASSLAYKPAVSSN